MTVHPPLLRQIDDLPGPRGVPLFGNALQIDTTRLHLQLERFCRAYGPFFKLKAGRRKLLVVADHEVVGTIFRNRLDDFRQPSPLRRVTDELGIAPGLFVVDGDAWRRQRRMVLAGLDPAHVKAYFPTLLRVAQRLAGRWREAATKDVDIDVRADLMRFAVDVVAGLAFGADVNTLESDHDVMQRHLEIVVAGIYRRLTAPLPTWRFVRLPADRRLERSVREANAAVAGFIAQARARLHADPALREHPTNLLEAMIVAADQPDSGIDDHEVAGNVFNLLLAGEDTTANTVAWMIHLLWLNPSKLALATQEVRRVLGDARTPGLEQLARLDYVDACARETMRLKPVVPQLWLQAARDTTIGDVHVPAGTLVFALLRRDSVSDAHVPRAATFEPERWMDDRDENSGAKRVSMPFGAGPRMCPGRYLALLEMKMVMTVLLGEFDLAGVEAVGGREASECLAFTMGPVGLRMRLRERARP